MRELFFQEKQSSDQGIYASDEIWNRLRSTRTILYANVSSKRKREKSDINFRCA